MIGELDAALAALLQDESGRLRIGQIVITPSDDGYELRHEADAAATALEIFTRAEDARTLALYDEGGAYRPLKSAPNLRRGWSLQLTSVPAVRRALDYFYPAMLGIWRDFHRGLLPVVPLRETLSRQTGMYAVTKKITDDQTQAMIGDFCRSDTGCLKQILWTISPGQPVTTLPSEKFQTAAPTDEMPLFCHECCNLLVAKAREVVKIAKAS